MAQLHVLKGDATNPQGAGTKIIAHICNDQGSWGKGFVAAVSHRWKLPEESYRAWYRMRATNDFALGNIQVVQVSSFVHIANMIGQHGIMPSSAGPPIRYEAVRSCLAQLARTAQDLGASVHMSRSDAGIAGSKWEMIKPMILETLVAAGVETYVYEFA